MKIKNKDLIWAWEVLPWEGVGDSSWGTAVSRTGKEQKWEMVVESQGPGRKPWETRPSSPGAMGWKKEVNEVVTWAEDILSCTFWGACRPAVRAPPANWVTRYLGSQAVRASELLPAEPEASSRGQQTAVNARTDTTSAEQLTKPRFWAHPRQVRQAFEKILIFAPSTAQAGN